MVFLNAQGIKCPEGSSAATGMGEVVSRSAGSLTAARFQEDDPVTWESLTLPRVIQANGEPDQNLRRAVGTGVRRRPVQKKHLDLGWAAQRGRPQRRPKKVRRRRAQ